MARLHRGVYSLAHTALPDWAKELAAVYACGQGAVLSHRSAAALWGIQRPPKGAVEVTVVGCDRARRRKNIAVHRLRALDPRDNPLRHGIPITSPARTLLDIAAGEPGRELERAVDEALVRRLTSRSAVLEVLSRYPHRPGCAALAELVVDSRNIALMRSKAESHFAALIRRAGLPAPEVNARIGPYEVDFLWRAERLIVEIDGYRYHSHA